MAKSNPGLGDASGHAASMAPTPTVTTFNGAAGDVFGVSSLNGVTGALEAVSSLNGATGDLTALTSFNNDPGPTIYYTYVPPIGLLAESVVSSWNGITGDVSFTQYVSDIADATGSITSFDGGTFS